MSRPHSAMNHCVRPITHVTEGTQAVTHFPLHTTTSQSPLSAIQNRNPNGRCVGIHAHLLRFSDLQFLSQIMEIPVDWFVIPHGSPIGYYYQNKWANREDGSFRGRISVPMDYSTSASESLWYAGFSYSTDNDNNAMCEDQFPLRWVKHP